VCQWAGHALSWARATHLPVFNAVAGLASHAGPCHGHVAGLALQPPPWQLEATRGGTGPLPGGKGGLGPRGQSEWTGPEGSGSHTWQRRTPLGGSGPVEAIPEHSALVGTWRRRAYNEEGPGTMIPAGRPEPYTSSPGGQGRGHG
jgi:hypothetical protein